MNNNIITIFFAVCREKIIHYDWNARGGRKAQYLRQRRTLHIIQNINRCLYHLVCVKSQYWSESKKTKSLYTQLSRLDSCKRAKSDEIIQPKKSNRILLYVFTEHVYADVNCTIYTVRIRIIYTAYHILYIILHARTTLSSMLISSDSGAPWEITP